MIISHTDRKGETWRFCVDCEPVQARAILRALAGVRNMRTAPACSLTEIVENEPRNAELFASIERAVLQGLAEAFPVIQVEAVEASEPTPPAELFPDEVEASPRRFWWED